MTTFAERRWDASRRGARDTVVATAIRMATLTGLALAGWLLGVTGTAVADTGTPDLSRADLRVAETIAGSVSDTVSDTVAAPVSTSVPEYVTGVGHLPDLDVDAVDPIGRTGTTVDQVADQITDGGAEAVTDTVADAVQLTRTVSDRADGALATGETGLTHTVTDGIGGASGLGDGLRHTVEDTGVTTRLDAATRRLTPDNVPARKGTATRALDATASVFVASALPHAMTPALATATAITDPGQRPGQVGPAPAAALARAGESGERRARGLETDTRTAPVAPAGAERLPLTAEAAILAVGGHATPDTTGPFSPMPGWTMTGPDTTGSLSSATTAVGTFPAPAGYFGQPVDPMRDWFQRVVTSGERSPVARDAADDPSFSPD